MLQAYMVTVVSAEPALFLVNPAGLLHVIVYSNASFARPDLKQIAQGELEAAWGSGQLSVCITMPVHLGSRAPSRCWVRNAAAAHSSSAMQVSGGAHAVLCCAGIKMVQDRREPIRGTSII